MLENFDLVSNLTEEQIQKIESICDSRTYIQGELIFRENECPNNIYFLVSGEVSLNKLEPQTGQNIQFKQMHSGQSFGEMSFMDGSPTSCSVKAESDSHIYILSKQKLISSMPDALKIINLMSTAITYQVNEYLRYLSDRYVIGLQQQIESLKDFSYFLLFILVRMHQVSAEEDG